MSGKNMGPTEIAINKALDDGFELRFRMLQDFPELTMSKYGTDHTHHVREIVYGADERTLHHFIERARHRLNKFLTEEKEQ